MGSNHQIPVMQNRLLLLFVFIFPMFIAAAQNPQAIEQDLLQHLKKINFWKFGEGEKQDHAYDSITSENDIFSHTLLIIQLPFLQL
jgi:hypothetical protein